MSRRKTILLILYVSGAWLSGYLCGNEFKWHLAFAFLTFCLGVIYNFEDGT